MKSLRTLVIDDSEDDASLIARELQQAGYQVAFLRVDDPVTLKTVLGRYVWDVVICDYKMPGFDGPSALRIFKETKLTVPFIVVSGVMGEEEAVAMMKAGANDYLLKHHLQRLVATVERELRETELRKERAYADAARGHLASIIQSSSDAIISTSVDGKIMSWNRGAEKMFLYSESEIERQPILSLVIPSWKEQVMESFNRVLRGDGVKGVEIVCLRKDQTLVDVSVRFSAILDSAEMVTGVSAVARDITERKQMEFEKDNLVQNLQNALAQVKTLHGLLPICSSCKKIRNDEGSWQPIEVYLQKCSEAKFTHGICPECMRNHYPQYAHKSDGVR